MDKKLLEENCNIGRIDARNKLRDTNKELKKHLHDKCKAKRPQQYSSFHDEKYKGLYDGLTCAELAEKKGLEKNQRYINYMGELELSANYFASTLTKEKLQKENITSLNEANKINYDMGKKVRDVIIEAGVTLPEDLPLEKTNVERKYKKKK